MHTTACLDPSNGILPITSIIPPQDLMARDLYWDSLPMVTRYGMFILEQTPRSFPWRVYFLNILLEGEKMWCDGENWIGKCLDILPSCCAVLMVSKAEKYGHNHKCYPERANDIIMDFILPIITISQSHFLVIFNSAKIAGERQLALRVRGPGLLQSLEQASKRRMPTPINDACRSH